MKNTSFFLKISSILLLLSAHNAVADNGCGRAICGCWMDTTVSYRLNIVDKNNKPIKNIQAVCANETAPIGKSNAAGLLQASVKTAQSPGCGIQRCGEIKLSDPARQFSEKTVHAVKNWQANIRIEQRVMLERLSAAKGIIYFDPKYTHASFKPHHLPFQLPTPFTGAKSEQFYAIILKSLPKCSIKDSERINAQNLFPKNKVFYDKNGCSGDYLDDLLSYTNINENYDFLAVYAGKTQEQAQAFAKQVARTGQFPGYNLRKMQVVYSLP